jgi:hypothetical protein
MQRSHRPWDPDAGQRYCSGIFLYAESSRVPCCSFARGKIELWTVLWFVCLERAVGILRHVFHLIFNIMWKKEMSAEALIQFVK